jgi:predicted nucleic acid-binding protein
VNFWDSSAVIPLLVQEGGTSHRQEQLRDDPRIAVWWACRLECSSALDRLRRDGSLDEDGLDRGLRALQTLADGWYEVQPSHELRARAMRLLRVHPLRAADAVQLAAALIASSEDPSYLPFFSADGRLLEAARKEGFAVG